MPPETLNTLQKLADSINKYGTCFNVTKKPIKSNKQIQQMFIQNDKRICNLKTTDKLTTKQFAKYTINASKSKCHYNNKIYNNSNGLLVICNIC